MKKVLAVVLAVCVVFGAGTAFAYGHRNCDFQAMNRPGISNDFGPRGPMGPKGEFGSRNYFSPDMPKEIREKAVELAKLKVDLEEAMTSEPVNKAKAIETHKKMQALKNEIESWKFEKRLDRIEEMKKHREEMRKAFHEKQLEKNEQ